MFQKFVFTKHESVMVAVRGKSSFCIYGALVNVFQRALSAHA